MYFPTDVGCVSPKLSPVSFEYVTLYSSGVSFSTPVIVGVWVVSPYFQVLGSKLIPNPVSSFLLTFNVTVAVYVSSFASVTVIVAVYSPALSPVFAFTLKSVFVSPIPIVGCVEPMI